MPNTKILKERLVVFVVIILLFVFIYDPPLNLINANLTTLVAIPSLFIILIRVLVKRKISFLNLKLLLPFCIIGILCVYSFILPLLSKTNDFQISRIYLIFLLVYLPTCYLIVLMLKGINLLNIKILFQLIIIICFIQSSVILLMFINSDFKVFIYSLLRDDRSEYNLLSGGIRMLGFAYSTVWDLAFLQSISLILIIYLLQKASKIVVFMYGTCYIIITGSIVLSGRTGFIGILFSIILMLLLSIQKQKKAKNFFLFLNSIVSSIVLILSILNFSLPADVKSIFTDKVIPWAFELFINKSEGGKFETSSSDDLKTMYFAVPVNTFLLGDARYRDPVDPTFYYLNTDAGYMRHILFYGIFGSLTLYLFYLIVFFKLIFKSYEERQYSLILVYSILLVYYFIGHIKGDLFVGAAMPIRLIFLIYIFHSSIKKEVLVLKKS